MEQRIKEEWRGGWREDKGAVGKEVRGIYGKMEKGGEKGR